MKIILGEKEVQLDGISIDQYETVKNFEGDMTNSQFISILTGLEDKEIRQATVQEIGFVSKMLNSYYQKQTDKNPLKQMVEYKGQILGLEQPSTMSWGCWSDLEILTSQKPLNLKLIASILYRPCERYNINDLSSKLIKYDYDECVERSKDMGDFKVTDVMASLFFFIKYAKILIDKQEDYMETQLKKMTEELLHQTKERMKKS